MPDVIAHSFMGMDVLAKLDREIASIIDADIFRFAVNGPDPYFFYRFFVPPFRGETHLRSNEMHERRTGDFLMALARRGGDDAMFSLLAGFLCHYALDASAHPYVNRLAAGRRYMHTAIEHRIDRMELSARGGDLGIVRTLFLPFPDLPGLREAIREIYGWDDDLFGKSYAHMKLWYRFAADRRGIAGTVGRLVRPEMTKLLYSSRCCDDMDLSGYAPLRALAVGDAAEMIATAHRFRRGEIDAAALRARIGSRTYDGDPIP